MKRILALLIACTMLFSPALSAQATAYGTSYEQQLAPQEKAIYKIMLDNYNSKTPSFSYKLNPSVPVVNEATGEEVRRWVYRAYEAVYRDHPEVFWVTKAGGMNISIDAETIGNKQNITSITMKVVYTDVPTISQKQAKLEAEIAQILSAAPKSIYDKLAYFHDTITTTCSYDEAAKASPTKYPESYEAYGALCNKKAVCEGYAKAFKLLCDRSGISCVLVGGYANGEAHMWNYVQIDGNYYLVDATFDDPIGGTPARTYLLKGSETTAKDHKPDSFFLENFDGKFTDPALSLKDYNAANPQSPAPTTPETNIVPTTTVPVANAVETPATPQVSAPQKQYCTVQYSGKSKGGNFTVAYAGVTGALDLKQSVLNGVCLEVRAYPQAGYKVSEIKAEMGASTLSKTDSTAFTFAVSDDCKISVTFIKK